MGVTLERVVLTRLERASGYILDQQSGVPPLPPGRGRARAALADAIRPALQRSPCLVSFSGGRDSSALLALAAHVARLDGLPAPIPFTLRFPEAPATDESDWQELVIGHIGLDDWERIELTTELDFLGDVAQRFITTHGLQWPPNAHVHAPIFDRARGGCVITGLDGDGLFGWSWAATRAALARPGRVSPRAVLRAGVPFAPYRVRLSRKRRSMPQATTWLHADAQREFELGWADALAREPVRWDRYVMRFARRRSPLVVARTLDLLATDHGSEAVNPLLDRAFLAALAAEGGRAGFGTRSAAMQALFGDLLPLEILTRRSKAEFSPILWGPHTRAFAEAWDGSGVDHELVDADALRREWARDQPVFGASTPLHDAWLSTQAA